MSSGTRPWGDDRTLMPIGAGQASCARYLGCMRSLLIAGAVGVLAGLVAHQLGALLVVLSLLLVVVALLLTLTVIGAIVGIPLLLLAAAGIALGAATAGGALPAVLFGLLVAVIVYTRLTRREHRTLSSLR